MAAVFIIINRENNFLNSRLNKCSNGETELTIQLNINKISKYHGRLVQA